jgi:plasmid stabilization system protein ParE
MAFRVEITPEAEYDGEAILAWLLSQGAGDTGIRWFLALEDAIASLANFPERCPRAPESAEFSFEVRHFALRPQASCVPCFVHD